MSRRSFRRRPPASYLVLAAFAFFILLRAGCQFGEVQPGSDGARPADAMAGEALVAGSCELVRVVDGDTLIVRQRAAEVSGSGGSAPDADWVQFRVRLLGIDTPETVKEGTAVEPWGPQATAFARDFVQQGPMRVELDKRRLDRFGRSLAYVYVNDEMLNLALVRAGLARVSSYPGDSQTMLRQLRQAETEARSLGAGIWSERPPQPAGAASN